MELLLAHGLPVKLPSDLYQHLWQAIEKGESECKQLAHEKGVQRVLGHLMPNWRNVALEVLAHPPGLVTEAKRVTCHPAKQGSEATWSSISRVGDGIGRSICVCSGAILQGSSGLLAKSKRKRRVTDWSTRISGSNDTPNWLVCCSHQSTQSYIPHKVSLSLKKSGHISHGSHEESKSSSTQVYLFLQVLLQSTGASQVSIR